MVIYIVCVDLVLDVIYLGDFYILEAAGAGVQEHAFILKYVWAASYWPMLSLASLTLLV